MENQDEDNPEEFKLQILHFIEDSSSNDDTIRQNAIDSLQSYTYQLQLLSIFEEILGECINGQSKSNIYYNLLILRDIIINRGCLLDSENHSTHIGNMLQIAESAIESIASDVAILNVFADAVSISCRFVFEKNREPPKEIFHFFESSERHKFIAACILLSLIFSIEKELPHESKSSHDSLKKKFKEILPNFYNCIFKCISTQPSPDIDPDIIKQINVLGVELFNKVTEFETNGFKSEVKIQSDLRANINFFLNTKEIQDFPPSFFLIDCLFNLYNEFEPKNGVKVVQSLECYLYLCNLFTNSKQNHQKKYQNQLLKSILYIINSTNQVLLELNNSPTSEDYIDEGFDKRDMILFLIRLANSISILFSSPRLRSKTTYIEELSPALKMSSDGKEIEEDKGSGIRLVIDFLNLMVDYSKSYIINDPEEFFIFWKIISQIDFKESNEMVIEMISTLFEFYISYLLNPNENLEQNCDEFFIITTKYLDKIVNKSRYNSFLLNHLFEMLTKCMNDCAQILKDQIDQIIEEQKEIEVDASFSISYQQIIIITTMLISLFDNFDSLRNLFCNFCEDLTKSIEKVMFSIIDFMLFQSENLNERLEVIGEIVAKCELCFTTLFSSYLNFKRTFGRLCITTELIDNVKNYVRNPNYKDNKIENFFIDHFVEVIKNFTDYTDLVKTIFQLLDLLENEGNFALISTPSMIELSTERVQPFDLETVPFEYLKEVIPVMYKVYSGIFNQKEFDIFLSSFDPQFSADLEAPENCFLLFSQLYGVAMNCFKKQELSAQLFEWSVENHFDDIMKSIQTHCKDKIIISIIVKFWLKISSIEFYIERNKPKKMNLLFNEENGYGIRYFKANVEIISILSDCCDDSQWLAMKIIYNSIIGDYANYGIMDFYHDDSLEKIIESFFYLIQNWAIGEKTKRLILITRIIQMFPRINIADRFLFKIENNLFVILDFLVQNLLINNEDVLKLNLWVDTCVALYELLVDAIQNDVKAMKFRQFYIVIIDALINLPFEESALVNSTADFLFVFLNYADEECIEFCTKFIDTVIDTFEDQYKENVSKIFEGVMNCLEPDENNEFKPSKNFVDEIKAFSIEMKPYHVEIANIIPFRSLFIRD